MGEVLIAGTAALLICIFLSPKFIAFLQQREFGQFIREEGPAKHHVKAGTPTMGGIIIVTAVSVPFLMLSDYDWRAVGVYGALMGCALLGFADDYIKIVRRRSLGLNARAKLLITLLISVGLWWIATEQAGLPETLRLRFVDYQIDLSFLAGLPFLVMIYIVVAGTTSAVNLTDGLDGLAAGCAAIVLLAFTAMTFITHGQKDLALLCACLVGACVPTERVAFTAGPPAARPSSPWPTSGSRSSRPGSTTSRCCRPASSAPASASCGSTRSRRRSSWAIRGRWRWAGRSRGWRS